MQPSHSDAKVTRARLSPTRGVAAAKQSGAAARATRNNFDRSSLALLPFAVEPAADDDADCSIASSGSSAEPVSPQPDWQPDWPRWLLPDLCLPITIASSALGSHGTACQRNGLPRTAQHRAAQLEHSAAQRSTAQARHVRMHWADKPRGGAR